MQEGYHAARFLSFRHHPLRQYRARQHEAEASAQRERILLWHERDKTLSTDELARRAGANPAAVRRVLTEHYGGTIGRVYRAIGMQPDGTIIVRPKNAG